MADSQVDVTEATAGTPTHLDAETLTVGAQAVKRERHRLAGGAAAELVDVRNVAPATTDYGLITRVAGVRRSGSLTYGACSDLGTYPSSGTTANALVSIGYLFHPSAVTGLVYRLARITVSWVDGVGGNGAALELFRITAENGAPGGNSQTKQGNNNSNTASSAIFRTGATGAPTRTFNAIDGAVISLGAPGSVEFGPAGEQDGQDYELQKSVAEGWEVMLTVGSVAPTTAAKFFISAAWREETT